jgi:hypothetical protein
MADLKEQNICVKFPFKFRKTVSEMHKMQWGEHRLMSGFLDSNIVPGGSAMS